MGDPENRTLTEKFMLRLPDGMRERIKVEAERNNRSMNAEIVARLEATLGEGLTKEELDQRLENVAEKILAYVRSQVVAETGRDINDDDLR